MRRLFLALYGLLLGSVFVLLGRWIYKNPKKVYPNWLYSNHDHPLLIGFVRIWATICIFVGCAACTIMITAELLPEFLPPILGLASGIAGARFLRPRVHSSAPLSPVTRQTEAAPIQNSFLSKKGKWVLAASGVFGVGLLFGIFALRGNSEICQIAVREAQASPAVVDRLGEPVTKGLMVSGTIETSGPSGHADVSIPLTGPRGKGTLYAVGTKSAGLWKFETLQLAVEGDPSRIDLLRGGGTEPKPIRR